MRVVKQVLGRPVPFGGEKHTGWLPRNAAWPERTSVRAAILDMEIQDHGDGSFILDYHSRNTNDSGDLWYETSRMRKRGSA